MPADTAGLIAFVTTEGRLALVDPTSGERGLIVSAEGQARFPSWSPDGEAIAAIRHAPQGATIDVYRPALGSFERVYASRDPPIYHDWSPDGSRLAVLAQRSDLLGLYLVPVPAGEPRLFAAGDPLFWSWTDGGAALLMHRNGLRPTAEVGITRLEAYELEVAYPQPGAFRVPAVAPDGRWIAYATRAGARPRDEVREVVLLRREAAASEQRLELPHASVAAFAWHPRRDWLAVQRSPGESSDGCGPIVLVDARSGEVTTVTDETSVAFWWSPDGGSIAYLTLVDPEDVGPLRHVSAHPAEVRLALWVVDLATGFRRQLARFSPSPALLDEYLPAFDRYARSNRLWSPASDALVLPVLDGHGVSMLAVFGLDGSVVSLGPGDMPAWNVR
jgi:TolB protein